MGDVGRYCKSCNRPYNSKTCKGCLLSCLHTVCETCFAYNPALPCPECRLPNSRPQLEKTTDYSLMEILESEEIPCESEKCPHLATRLCETHWKALCQTCACGDVCKTLSFNDSEMDIGGFLYSELEDKRDTVPKFAERHFRVLGSMSNRTKLQLVRSLYVVPYCSECKEPAQTSYYFFLPGDFYCHSCAGKLCETGKLVANYFSLNHPIQTPIDIMRKCVQDYLHTVDIFSVPAQVAELYRLLRDKFDTGSLYDIQKIAKLAFALTSTGMRNERTVCPGCIISFPTTLFRPLPCLEAAHGICQSCWSKEEARSENVIRCPTDRYLYRR